MGFRLTAVITMIGVACPAMADINFMQPETASSGVSSGQALTANSTRLQTDNRLYQALYSFDDSGSSEDWTGDLYEIEIPSGGLISNPPTVLASASAYLNTVSPTRHVYSYDGGGVVFNGAWLNTVSASLGSVVPSGKTVGQLADYLLGEEIIGFRERSSPLGDIIRSAPEYAGNIDFGYAVTSGGAPSMGEDYLAFLDGTSASRKNMVYIGANDGMLHGLRVDDVGSDNQLEEVFAYLPSTLLPKLTSLASPSYTHQYYVDGSPKVADAYNNGWKTVLVGTTGAGGQAVFALDVTNPASSFGTSNVLWEINNLTSGFLDLGYTLPQPSIVLLEDDSPNDDTDSWAAVVSSGYQDSDGDGDIDNAGVLYLIDLFSGSQIASVAAGSAGLSTPVAIDSSATADRAADIIYAGDLDGKLWKFYFDPDESDPDEKWKSVELYNAPQPITGKPQVVDHPDGGFMVLFGTGKYFAADDKDAVPGAVETSGPSSETTIEPYGFYGVWDDHDPADPGANAPAPDPSTVNILVDGEELSLTVDGSSVTATIRITDENNSNSGWFMPLYNYASGSDIYKEMVVSEPLVRNERVVFTTLIPDGTSFSGEGWLMEVDAITGSRLKEVALDIDNNGEFDSGDKVSIKQGAVVADGTGGSKVVNVSGLKSTVGLISTPNVISTSNKELKYMSGSSGDIQTVQESTSNAAFDKGRQSWQQLK